MSHETILTNAVLVLRDETILGTLVMHGSVIADIQAGASRSAGRM